MPVDPRFEAAAKPRVFVADATMAAALIACGVRQVVPAVCIENGDGTRRVLFSFEEYDSDRIIDVKKAVEAVHKPAEWIAQNPTNPLSFALAALMQHAFIQRSLRSMEFPTMAVTTKEPNGPTVYVRKDSRVHRAMLKRGMVNVNTPTMESELTTACRHD